MSNAAWDWLKKTGETETDAEIVSQYTKLVKTYGTLFEEQLKKMKVSHTSVVTKVDNVAAPAVTEGQTVIVAVPAGYEPEDQVLTHIGKNLVTFVSSTGERQVAEVEARDWRDVVLTEMVKKCNDATQRMLLQYCYGLPAVPVMLAAFVGGSAAGAASGAGVGGVAKAGPTASVFMTVVGLVAGGISAVVAAIYANQS